MVELMGLAAFHRFLFTIWQRSGICAVAYGTETATSFSEGRRSLGIDIFRLADVALSVRSNDGMPIAAISIAISEGLRSQTQEPDDEDRTDPDAFDNEPDGRR